MAKKLRCYLGIHRWREFRNDDGERYRTWIDCGKFVDISPTAWVG